MIGSCLGAYEIVAELGSGGMGTVYRAETTRSVASLEPGFAVALKVIHPHLLESEGFFERFAREARIGQEVRQANVVRCLDCDVGAADGQSLHYLVMEYVEGQTLRALLDEMGVVSEELCRHIGCEVAEGLAAIHAAGAIHRDIKPENILITPAHEIKIMDLGLARLVDEATRLSQTGQFIGSLLYAAPEALRGKDVDGRVDLHGLGLVLYELATGRQPFRHDDMKVVLRNVLESVPRRAGELNPQVSPFFEEVLATLLQKEVDERFPAAADLLAVLSAGEAACWWTERAAAIRHATRKPLRRIRIPRETAVYGRDDDLALLSKAYVQTEAGEGQVLLLEGEAGIGKTRLVDEFMGRLEREGKDVNFLLGSYPPGGAATAVGAWSTAYREHFGAEGSAAYLEDMPGLVPTFDALLRGESAPKGAEPFTKESLQTAFVRATQALAAERPTVVMIEDLHLAPEEGRALFASLTLAVQGHAVLLIGTSRPELPEAWVASLTRLEQVEHRSLQRLGPKDLSLLLEDAFHSARLAEALGVTIARKSDGNPFFAFEIVRGLKEGQFLAQCPDGSWVSTGAIGELQIPSSVLDLVNARVSDLDEADRDLLDVAACVGFEFDPSLVVAAVGMDPIAGLKRFGQIERRHRLVRSVGRKYAFDHHQVQEALRGALNDQLREAYHARIAETLEVQAGARETSPNALDGALCLDLCKHYLAGARGEDALRYLDEALTHLEEGYLNDQAVRLCERALAVPALLEGARRIEILLRVTDRLNILARRDAERSAGEEALALARKLGDARAEVQALQRLVRAHDLEGNFEVARELCERQRELARAIQDELGEASAALRLANILATTGKPQDSEEVAREALALYRAAGDRHGEGEALSRLGAVLLRQARFADAEAPLKEALSLARELGDRRLEIAATGNLAGSLWFRGRVDEAGMLTEQMYELARKIGDRYGEAQCVGNMGIFEQSRCRYANTIEYMERALLLGREIGDRQAEAACRITLGGVYSNLCDAERAWHLLEESHRISAEIQDRRLEGYAICGLGAIAADLGRLGEAVERYEQGLAFRREHADPNGVADALGGLGEMLIRAGRKDEALEPLEEGLKLARELGSPDGVISCACNRALLRAEYVPEARQAMEELGPSVSPVRRIECLRLLWDATGELSFLEEARPLLQYVIEHAPEEYRARIRETPGSFRAVLERTSSAGDEA